MATPSFRTAPSLSQKDRDSTLYTATLRTGYEISPAITPFTEVEVGRRAYDLRFDTDGFERSSTRLGARAGVATRHGREADRRILGRLAAGRRSTTTGWRRSRARP